MNYALREIANYFNDDQALVMTDFTIIEKARVAEKKNEFVVLELLNYVH